MVTVTVAETPDDAAFRKWWRRLALLGGIASIVLGLVLMIWPEATLRVVAVLLGLWLLLSGAIRVVQAAFVPEGRAAGARVLEAFVGLVLIAIGALCMRNLTNSLAVIAALIGVSWLFAGVAWIFSAFSDYRHGWGRLGAVVLGLISIAGALVILIWPKPSLLVVVWLCGLWFVALGVVQLILGWSANRALKAGQAAGSAGTPRPAR